MKEWKHHAALGTEVSDTDKTYCITIRLLDENYEPVITVNVPSDVILQAFKEIVLLEDKGYIDRMKDSMKIVLQEKSKVML